ncbi:hypothetical protein IWQ61_010210, partial [Dispira simplex]
MKSLGVVFIIGICVTQTIVAEGTKQKKKPSDMMSEECLGFVVGEDLKKCKEWILVGKSFAKMCCLVENFPAEFYQEAESYGVCEGYSDEWE